MNLEHECPIQRQLIRLAKYDTLESPPLAERVLNTRTTFYSQRDNHTMPHRTCNSSSNAMYLDWLRRVTGREGLGGDDGYLKTVLKHGDTIHHWAQTKAIRDYGFSTQWMTDNDFPFVKDLVLVGFPVVVNILHRGKETAPRGGHVIMLIGYRPETKVFVTHDPYGTLASDYTNTNGAFSLITERTFKRRWQGGYRTLAQTN